MNGEERISIERKRQRMEEGWTKEHDRHYGDFELLNAAICYINESKKIGFSVSVEVPQGWPWGEGDWKPLPAKGVIKITNSIRMLEKAGALIAAEIDRLLNTN